MWILAIATMMPGGSLSGRCGIARREAGFPLGRTRWRPPSIGHAPRRLKRCSISSPRNFAEAAGSAEFLGLLDEALGLDGWGGAEHRAIIAPRLGFLLHVAPEWVESRDARLFGDEAPDDLGQKTVGLALKWGRPNRWLHERHDRAIFKAVRDGSTNALDQALVAMLWEVPGYSIETIMGKLAEMDASVVSD